MYKFCSPINRKIITVDDFDDLRSLEALGAPTLHPTNTLKIHTVTTPRAMVAHFALLTAIQTNSFI